MQFVLGILCAVTVRTIGTSVHTGSGRNAPRAVDNRHIFSPRMDYDEWKPLGRGDPLKNDPTYDYVPPVLDRVHYWMDPSKRTPDPPLPNSEVSTSQTEAPSTTLPATSRLGTMSLLDPFIKFMDASKASLGFSTHTSNYFRPTPNPPYHSIPQHNPSRFNPTIMTHTTDYVPPPPPKGQALQRPPYTMLMPPPPPPPSLQVAATTDVPMTSFATSTQTTTEAEEASSTINAMTLDSLRNDEVKDMTTITPRNTTIDSQTTILGSSENLYKPVAITMPESISNQTMELPSTTPVSRPTPEDMTLPIISLFNDESNHLQEMKPPSHIMIPPSKKSNGYFGFLPTTVRPSTTVRALTTDPMFKHYKQPNEAVRGPFYLIIQGHSKVKTYGASKNRIKPISSNEINFEDGKSKHYANFNKDEGRRERRLWREDVSDNEEVIEGKPTIEVMASYRTKGQMGYSVGANESNIELDSEFIDVRGRSSEQGMTDTTDTGQRVKRFVGRKLLGSVSTTEKHNTKDKLSDEQLGLESLIALNEDYSAEDIVNLLLKEEGQGSGFGNFAASLLGRSLREEEEM